MEIKITESELKELKEKAEKWDQAGFTEGGRSYNELERENKSLKETNLEIINEKIELKEHYKQAMEIVQKVREYIENNKGYLLAHDELKEILGDKLPSTSGEVREG